jgi:polyphenol oxidase
VIRPASWLAPAWANRSVGALMSTREGGLSSGPYASMNLGVAVGDEPDRVAANRARFAAVCGATPVFLRQVHGTRVVRLGTGDLEAAGAAHEADASVTTEPGIACTVQAADCLPVLFAAPGARGVAAAHAGWRGLAAGVLEATAAALCDAARCRPGELEVWIGVCIGPRAFEVGPEVLEAFGVATNAVDGGRFQPAKPGKWLADLAGLARDRLAGAGVERITAASGCACEDASRFFSYRRDRITGRMAAAVWIVDSDLDG